MATQVIARAKMNDGKKSGNNFRFMPARTGRTEGDKQTVFRSLPYVRVLREANELPMIGAVIGPSKEVVIPGSSNPVEQSVLVEKHSKVIELAQVASRDDTVKIRSFVTPEDMRKPEGERLIKKFIDWASFQELAPNDVRLVKYLGNDTVNIEIWSGLFEPLTEEMYQLASTFMHGSVAYAGGRNVAKAKKGIIDPTDSTNNQRIARNMAKLLMEEHGEQIGTMPVWSVKTWEIKHSPKDSEMVLVRHANAYYLVQVEKGEAVVITKYTGSDATKWDRRFKKLLGEELVAQQAKAEIDQGLARQSAA